jgi:uncharacterized protein (DUF1330 family)
LRTSIFQISTNTRKYAVANAVPFNKYGGKFLTRGGKSEMVEGKFRSRVVLIEFEF